MYLSLGYGPGIYATIDVVGRTILAVPRGKTALEGRLSRSRARGLGLDPLHDIKEEPSTWDANRNLMLRPRGGEDGCAHRDEVGEVQELLLRDLPM